MLKKRYNIILLIIIAIGLVASLAELTNRAKIENDNRTVTIALDYFQLHRFARYNGIEIDDLLDRLKSDGFDTIALLEDTPEFLEERGIAAVVKGFNIEKRVLDGPSSRQKKEKPEINYVTEDKLVAQTLGLSPNDVHLIFKDDYMSVYKDDYKTVYNLTQSWGKRIGYTQVRRKVFDEEGVHVITLKGDPEEMYHLGAGFRTSLFRELQDHGFKIIPRLRNNRFVDSLKNMKQPTHDGNKFFFPAGVYPKTIIMDGDEVLGYPAMLKEMKSYLQYQNMSFGYIEFAKQDGDKALANLMLPNVLRVHSISDEEMEVYTPKKAVARFVRAVKERNVRIVYLKPFFVPTQGTNLVETNIEYFKSVKNEIEKAGFKIGQAKPFEKAQTSFIANLLILFAVGASLLLLLSWGWQIRSYLLLIAVIIISIISASHSQESMIIKSWGVIAGITFPAMGIALNFDIFKKRGHFPTPLLSFPLIVLFTLTGASIVAAMFSTTSYMLNVESYSGVKISFVIPIFLAALIGVRLFFRQAKSGFLKELAFLGDMEIKLKHIILFAVIAFAGFILITRSGNEPILSVSQIENTFRGLLEGFFSVRPRTKEFLIGHPLLILSLFSLYRYNTKFSSLAFICLIGGLVGQVSMFNTFCHFHTPLDISIERTIYGLIVGILGGLILSAILYAINKKVSKLAS
ncbi:hypothetical protein J7L05_10295 [bacterium]|nr:hypothetical protein [bacterium]